MFTLGARTTDRQLCPLKLALEALYIHKERAVDRVGDRIDDRVDDCVDDRVKDSKKQGGES